MVRTLKAGATVLAICLMVAHGRAQQGPRGTQGALPVAPDSPLGTGPYKALMEMDAALMTHTAYRPADLTVFGATKLPIIAWGNGACANAGDAFRPFLTEIASHGYLAVAIGPIVGGARASGPVAPGAVATPGAGAPPAAGAPPVRAGGPATSSSQLVDAIDWAVRENTRRTSKYFGKLDTTKIAVMGQSCGGVQAVAASVDPRVTITVGWNTGLVGPRTTGPIMEDVPKETLEKLHGPVAYFTGDPGDVAHPNAADDFKRLEAIGRLPALHAWKDGMTHGGTYREENGGEMARIAVAYLAWRLKGDQTAGRMFTGPNCGLCTTLGWHVSRARIE